MFPRLEEREWDVFVSHASADLEDARWVRRHLERAGWKCFLAHEQLDAEVGSAMWSKKIDEVLDGSGAVVVIVSPQALASRWVEHEWRTFSDDIRNGRSGIVVPCCIDGPAPHELQRGLRAHQVVDLREPQQRDSTVPRLLDLIEGLLKHPIERSKEQHSLTRLLSLEGSGVRSLLVSRLLVALEDKLAARLGSGTRIADAFDLVAGNSMGGFLACSIAVRTPAVEIHDRLARKLPRTFKRRFLAIDQRHRCDPAGLDWMSDFFDDRTLRDLDVRCLVPVYDIAANEPVLLGGDLAREDASWDIALGDVVRASCSTPTFFPPTIAKREGRRAMLVDGSVSEPDPTRLALADARRLIQPRPLLRDTAVLSIGSGDLPEADKSDAPDQPSIMWWFSRLMDISLRSSAVAARESLADQFDRRGVPHHYVRLDPELPPPRNRWGVDKTDDVPGVLKYANTMATRLDDHLEAFLDIQTGDESG